MVTTNSPFCFPTLTIGYVRDDGRNMSAKASRFSCSMKPRLLHQNIILTFMEKQLVFTTSPRPISLFPPTVLAHHQTVSYASEFSSAMAIAAVLSQPWSLVFSLGAIVALWWAWRVLELAWINPRRLGLALQAQGLRGTAYRFPFGDLKEFARLVAVARSKPIMPPSHSITPRVAPLYHNVIKEHGK